MFQWNKSRILICRDIVNPCFPANPERHTACPVWLCIWELASGPRERQGSFPDIRRQSVVDGKVSVFSHHEVVVSIVQAMHIVLKDVLYYLSLYGVFKTYRRRWKSTLKGRKMRHPLTLPLPDNIPLPVYQRKKKHQQGQQQLQNYHPQTQSIFFRLPLEIRNEIYSYAFGGKSVKRPSCVRSADWHYGRVNHHHGGHQQQQQQQHAPQRIQWADIIPIALLQTCRQM